MKTPHDTGRVRRDVYSSYLWATRSAAFHKGITYLCCSNGWPTRFFVTVPTKSTGVRVRYVFVVFPFFFFKPFSCQPLKTNSVAHTTPSNKKTGHKRSDRDGRDDNKNALNLLILCVDECDFVRDTIPGQIYICYNGIQKKEKIFIVFSFK